MDGQVLVLGLVFLVATVVAVPILKIKIRRYYWVIGAGLVIGPQS